MELENLHPATEHVCTHIHSQLWDNPPPPYHQVRNQHPLQLPRTAKPERGGQHLNVPNTSENVLANVLGEFLSFMVGDSGLSEKPQ